jgi:1-deoxy-D-xylulose-5-phosphate synthase
VQVLAIPQQFLEPGPRAELLGDLGLTAQAVARGITEEIARTFAGPADPSAAPVAGDRDPGAAG